MKFRLAFCLALVGAIAVSCKMNNDKRKSFSDVVEYNDYLIDHIDEINEIYMLALDTSLSFEEALIISDSLVVVCEQTTDDIKGIQPFEGDSSLAMQALEYTQFMKLNGKKHLKDFLKLEQKYIESADLSEEESNLLFNQAEEMIQKMDKIRDKELEKVDLVQEKFARKYNMTVID